MRVADTDVEEMRDYLARMVDLLPRLPFTTTHTAEHVGRLGSSV